MKPAISVLGTGRMGSALVRALLEAGHRTTVWNRTAEEAAPLAGDGAVVAASVREAVEAAEIVIVNVTDYAATAALLQWRRRCRGPSRQAGRGAGLPERLDGAREAGRWAASHGVSYLDGAIMATPDFIGTEHGTILVSGPKHAFDAAGGMFPALGGNVQHVGEELGPANALDSALLAADVGALFGTLHAIAVSRAEKIELGELARQWTATAPVVEGLVADLIKRTQAERFAADGETLSSISPHYSAFQHLVELMEARNIDRTVVDGYGDIFRRAIAAGHLQDDFAAMSQFMGRTDR